MCSNINMHLASFSLLLSATLTAASFLAGITVRTDPPTVFLHRRGRPSHAGYEKFAERTQGELIALHKQYNRHYYQDNRIGKVLNKLQAAGYWNFVASQAALLADHHKNQCELIKNLIEQKKHEYNAHANTEFDEITGRRTAEQINQSARGLAGPHGVLDSDVAELISHCRNLLPNADQ